MKICPQCQLSYEDSAQNCSQCGKPLVTIPNQVQQTVVNPNDHTAEFDAADISANKVLAMIPYLMGWIGIIITLLASGTSAYAGFHVRQALKIQVITTLSLFFAIIPFLGWLVIGIWAAVAMVINLICFFRVCKGTAVEPPIVSDFKFLK